MISLLRTDAKNEDFIALVAQLDADLAERDGTDHSFYSQFNSIVGFKYAIVLYLNKKAVGCGAIKAFDSEKMEVKRMYVSSETRGKGLATRILNALENWTAALGYKYCILETGKRQPEAIALYEKNGYARIPNYEPYVGIENSVCFQKTVSS